MSQQISWIAYRGYNILVADFSGLQNDTEHLAVFDAMEAEMLRSSQGKQVPAIIDISGSRMTQSVAERGRTLITNMKAAGVPDSPAVIVGGTGFQKAVIASLSVFRQDVMTANSREEAQELLVKYLEKRK